MTEPTPAEMSKADAKKLTQKIKTAVDDLWSLLVQAHEGKAWKALGYQTWEAYVSAEFSMSRQRSYQLIDQGKVIRAIAEATGENVKHVGQITARDAAVLKADLPSSIEQITAKINAGEAPDKAVAETARAQHLEKERVKAEKSAQQEEDEFAEIFCAVVLESSQTAVPPSPAQPSQEQVEPASGDAQTEPPDAKAEASQSKPQPTFDQVRAAILLLADLTADDFNAICPPKLRAAMYQKLAHLEDVFAAVRGDDT